MQLIVAMAAADFVSCGLVVLLSVVAQELHFMLVRLGSFGLLVACYIMFSALKLVLFTGLYIKGFNSVCVNYKVVSSKYVFWDVARALVVWGLRLYFAVYCF